MSVGALYPAAEKGVKPQTAQNGRIENLCKYLPFMDL